MAEAQYNRYMNLHVFAEEWRKYKVNSKPVNITVFRNTMQTDEYIIIDCTDMKDGSKVLIHLIEPESKYAKTTHEIKKLLNKIKNNKEKSTVVIFVTYRPFNIYGKKALAAPEFKHLTIYTYLHEIFDMILPNGPLCYPHRIMSRSEVLNLCNNELYCYIENLPKIFDEDPQCIWIGAKGGDVIEIKMLSYVSGVVYQYKTVVPKTGRLVYAKNLEKVDEVAGVADEEEGDGDKAELMGIDDDDDDD